MAGALAARAEAEAMMTPGFTPRRSDESTALDPSRMAVEARGSGKTAASTLPALSISSLRGIWGM